MELTAELAEARVRSLVEQQHFFDTHWLATEGLIDIDRFSAMFGIFGLAECVNLLMAYEHAGSEARYGHDAAADALGRRVVERVAELVAQRPMPYCEGGNGFCYLHSQSGIDLDNDVTAGTRIPVGDEPSMFEHINTCAPHHRFFASGISDIFHVDETAVRNPRAVVDIIRGAFASGMRDFTKPQLNNIYKLRRVLAGVGGESGSNAAAMELLIERMQAFKSNEAFLAEVGKSST